VLTTAGEVRTGGFFDEQWKLKQERSGDRN
jgi:hypothetical protein